MDAQPIAPGTKVRLRAGAEVHSTRDASRGPNKRTRAITVHHSNEAGYHVVGRIHEDGSVSVYTHVLRTYDIFSAQIARLTEVIELLECVTSQADLNELVTNNPRVTIKDGRVLFEAYPARVTWVGTGSYWCWTDLSNIITE